MRGSRYKRIALSLQVGDPLELRMFESTGWELLEPGQDDTSKYEQMMPTTVKPPTLPQQQTQVRYIIHMDSIIVLLFQL